MTMALCFNCGHTKFGALVPCDSCGAGATGNLELDIAFSDHHLSVGTIAAFGEVIRAIRRVCKDEQLCFSAFIRYVAVNHSDILGVEMPKEQQAACDEVLLQASPQPVVIESSELDAD